MPAKHSLPSTTKKRAFVTGGDGLLGSHLVRKLLAENFDVRVFVLPGSPSPTLDDLPIECVPGDLARDAGLIKESVQGCDFVFHCAAITDLWAPPELVWKVNLDGTRTLLDAAINAGVKRFIHTGSASSFAFGTLQHPGNEQSPYPSVYRGIPYMESKHRAMGLVREAAAQRKIETVIVAPTFMLGDLDSRPSSGELIRQFVARGIPFSAPGGRNFAYAPDVAEAMVAALTKAENGAVYIAGGHNLPYFDFFSHVAKIAGTKPPRLILPRPILRVIGAAGTLAGKITGKKIPLDWTTAKLATMGTYYSSAKATADLGLKTTPIEIGIEQTIAGLRAFGHL